MSFINLEMQNGASNYGRILEWVSLLKVQITFSFERNLALPSCLIEATNQLQVTRHRMYKYDLLIRNFFSKRKPD
jgi:hypothetical protein